jgi:hypothetical protein
VHDRESGEWAAELVEKAVWREHLRARPLVLHADNGAAPTAYESVRIFVFVSFTLPLKEEATYGYEPQCDQA